MTRKKLLRSLVVLMLFIFALDYVGRIFHWYYSIWYFDLITHFLGGFWVALFFLYLFLRFDRQASIVHILWGVLLIGILWEIFEYVVFNRIGIMPFDALDTGIDLMIDLLGGACGVFYVYKRIFAKSVPAL